MPVSNQAYSLQQLALTFDLDLDGEQDAMVYGIAPLDKAKAGDISFFSKATMKNVAKTCEATAIVTTSALAKYCNTNVLISDDPYLSYAKLSKAFDNRPKISPGIDSSAVIENGATVDKSASIAAGVFVAKTAKINKGVRLHPGVFVGEGVEIGKDSEIHPNVSIYHDVCIGRRCVIHAGSVIGSDGFGFAPTEGKWEKILQLGNVIIGNDVEIGANVSIDRAALGSTVIGDNVIIDNLVHIAHNVIIGKGTAIAGQCGFAGSSEVGEHCQFAGQVGVNGHVTLTAHSVFTGKAMVVSDIKEKGAYSSGVPAHAHRKWQRNALRFTQLEAINQRIKALEKKLNDKE